ncbi:MAG: hypothetical protein M1838_005016, partial [Thelocarpon superellum]
MATMVGVPDSPPELTGSKSSKSSSSFRSSSQLDHDAISTDISHFEEIGLDDEQPVAHLERAHPPKRPGPGPMPRTSMGSARGGNTPATGSPRDLTNTSRALAYPSITGSVTALSAEPEQLALPDRLNVRRGLVSPSTPSLNTTMARPPRARSSSPMHHNAPLSPRAFTTGVGHLKPGPSLGPRPHSRRSSWQPSRKSVQQLEEECHDSDEDVPDEAVIWNVPISPRPPHERQSSVVSAHTSASTSPERKSPLSRLVAEEGGSFSSPLSHAQRPVDNFRRQISGSVPTSPTQPHMPRGLSTTSFPPMDTIPKHVVNSRTKSWNAALSELSEEAKVLTEALEAHADKEERRHEERVQSGLVVSTNFDPTKSRVKSTTVELPPLRKSDVMIDPLPISKEKEAVLTRTRPSWLPPKDKREDKKHLREYQKMMALSLEAERKKAAREREARLNRDDNAISILRIWDQHVLPDWDRVVREPRTRELWWRGVAPRSRGTVWQRAVGNELELSAQSYHAALQRAKDFDRSSKADNTHVDDRHRRQKEWFRALRRDVGITFRDLRIFQPGGPLHDHLVEVLMAYSMYRSDVGYVHGTHLIAALLLLNMPSTQAFITLANLMNRPIPLAFLTADAGASTRAYNITLRTLAYKFPTLHAHLTSPSLGLHPSSYLDPLFSTLLGHALSIDLLARVWDVYVFEGDGVLVRAIIACFGQLEQRLLSLHSADEIVK